MHKDVYNFEQANPDPLEIPSGLIFCVFKQSHSIILDAMFPRATVVMTPEFSTPLLTLIAILAAVNLDSIGWSGQISKVEGSCFAEEPTFILKILAKYKILNKLNQH